MRLLDKIFGGSREAPVSEPIPTEVANNLTTELDTKVAPEEKRRFQSKLERNYVYSYEKDQADYQDAVSASLDPILPIHERVLDYYKEATKDLTIKSQIRSAHIKVTKEPFVLIDKNGKEDKERTKLLKKKWFDELGKGVLSAEFWGHMVAELGGMYYTGNPLAPYEFRKTTVLDRYHIRPEDGKVFYNELDATGITYRDVKEFFVLEYGTTYTDGLLFELTRYALYKKFGLGDWSRSSEKWGDPMLVMFNASSDETETDEKENYLANFGRNGFAMLGEDDKLEMLERSQSDSHKIFLELIKYVDSENSKGINGQTSTADEKAFVGSAEVHERLFDDYTEMRLRDLMYYHKYRDATTRPYVLPQRSHHSIPYK